ncbi:MAG: hypothetical protein U0904_01385 [Candidatus Nanopelagicales bacterium]|nr:hypothetical protein [Candidatus Nanopelagicales bacterium]
MYPRLNIAQPSADTATISAALAQRLLGISDGPLLKLRRSGYLPDLRITSVTTLAARPVVSVERGILPVLRMGAPREVVEETEQGVRTRRVGVGVGYSDSEFLNATEKWWTANPDEICGAGVMAVTISGFVVGLLQIRGIIATDRLEHLKNGQVTTVEKRYHFDATVVGRVVDLPSADVRVSNDDPDLSAFATQLLGNRIESARGAPLICLR